MKKKADIWKFKNDHPYLFASVLIVTSFIVAVLIELFIFNRGYFQLNSDQRGIFTLSEDQISTTGFTYSEGEYRADELTSSMTIEFGNLKAEEINFNAYDEKNVVNVIAYSVVNTDTDEKVEVSGKTGNKIDSAGASLVSIKNSDNATKMIINFSGQTVDDGSDLLVSNIQVNNDLNFNWFHCMICFAILAIILLFSFYWAFFGSKLHFAYLVIAISFGLILIFLLPFGYGYDENAHFIKAYQTAAFDFTSTEENLEWPEQYLDLVDINQAYRYQSDNYQEFIDFLTSSSTQMGFSEGKIQSTASSYLPVIYIFYAVGINIAKLFHPSLMSIFYTGKIFSFICITILSSLVIKNTKKGKIILFFVCLLPQVLFLNSCYSADPLMLVSALALISICINAIFNKQKRFTWKRILIYLLALLMMVSGKMTYFPIGFLLWCVPLDRFDLYWKGKNWNKLVKWGLPFLGAVFAAFVFWYSNNIGLNLWQVPGSSTSEQVMFILFHPLTYLKILYNWFQGSFQQCFLVPATNLAQEGNLGDGLGICYLIVMLWMSIVENNDTSIVLESKENRNYKLWALILIAFSWILVATALYVTFTPVASPSIDGLQGRYFIPLIPLFLLLFQSQKIQSKYNQVKLNLAAEYFCFVYLLPVIKLFYQHYMQ